MLQHLNWHKQETIDQQRLLYITAEVHVPWGQRLEKLQQLQHSKSPCCVKITNPALTCKYTTHQTGHIVYFITFTNFLLSDLNLYMYSFFYTKIPSTDQYMPVSLIDYHCILQMSSLIVDAKNVDYLYMLIGILDLRTSCFLLL